MSSRVIWKPEAEDDLADIWMNAPDPDVVRLAVEAIEALLTRDPVDAGDSRDDEFRIVFDGPVGVLFDVSEAAQVVRVLRVGWYGRRP